ncbi:hypothetical protein D3C71_1655670 [compost metagenome]
MNNRVHLADMRQEFVAETFALARAAHQSRDVHEFKCRRHRFVRYNQLRQLIETLVRNLNHADIGVDRAERIVRGLRARLRNCVKQRRFAHVGQTHDTRFQSHLYDNSHFSLIDQFSPAI